jgi:RNA polymerase sigma factor (sigma-70 family)
MHELERGTTGAVGVLGDISASFGVSTEDIVLIAVSIAERRRLIQQATQRLVESNLRLVVYFAQRAQWRGADIADLVQEGNIALMKAVESFDPSHGLAFGTFATIRVCRAIHRFGATASQLVHVPANVRARRRWVRKTADYLSEKQGDVPSLDAVAEYLEV